MRAKFFFLSMLALMLEAVIPAQAEQVVKTFTLDNGMEVIAIPDHRAPVVTHMVWYRVGSAEEPAGKSGIAHFLEHLMFKGTEKVPGGDFAETVARNGGKSNAFTSYDYTAYFQRVARRHLPLMMEMEADRMKNLSLSSEDVTIERGVVLEERSTRVDSQPLSLLGEKMSVALYGEHPYGRPIIGWRDEIEDLDRADALEFYRRFYAPNNAALVVAGDVEPDELLELAKIHYGGIESDKQAVRDKRPEIAEIGEPVRVTYEDKRARQPIFQRIYLAQSYHTAGLEHATSIDMLVEILGVGTTSRLYRSLVVEQKLAVSAGAWAVTDSLDRGRIGLYAIPNEGVTPETLEAAIDAVIAEFVEKGVEDEEMERVRRSYLADLIYGWDDQQQQAYVFGASWSSGILPRDVLRWPGVVRTVTGAQVASSAREYLRAENSVTGWLLPASKP
ncbi:MAG: pitrilysin family protein [Hyphomicrobiales bacterium]|nr:pitrilysin family protein [Hyphomicrobiales bacterium]